MAVAQKRGVLRLSVPRLIQECGQPPEILDGLNIARRGQSGLEKKRAEIVLVRPKIGDLSLQFRQTQRVERAQIAPRILRRDGEVVQWRGHEAPKASPDLAYAFFRSLHRLLRSRIYGLILEQPASTWTRISCSSTLESINFSAFNRFRLKAG